MKISLLFLASLIVLALPASAAERAPETSPAAVLRHVVAFKFKTDTAPAQIKKAEDEFKTLSRKIPQIHAFEMGTNVSQEKRDKGFTHAFLVTFKTEKDRDGYLVHPAHEEFVKLVLPVIDDVFVIDYWTGKP
jgi:hypothetical protein